MTMDRQQLMAHRLFRDSDKRLRFGGVGILLTMWLGATSVQAADLQDLDFTTMPGDKAQVTLTFSEPVAAPENFATDEPARIVRHHDHEASLGRGRVGSVDGAVVRLHGQLR